MLFLSQTSYGASEFGLFGQAEPAPPAGSSPPSCSITGPTTLNTGETAQFNSSPGTITSYAWTTTGGLSVSGIASSFRWGAATPGVYTIYLTVSGPSGTSSCQINVTVNGISSAQSATIVPVIPKGGPITGRVKSDD